MFESKAGVFLIAGLGFFILAFLVMGLLPWIIYADEPELTVEQIIARDGIIHEFVDLAERFPDAFQKYYGRVDDASYARALRLGRDVYVAEACWHCHSQQVRPVSNEDLRWGPVAHALEYQNELQRPVLFGTRRVGPDLSREGARHGNDWHVAHFIKPTNVAPTSVMPTYPWFFDAEGYPNERGIAIITYVQWLGSWLDAYPYYVGEGPLGPQTDETDADAADDTDAGGASASVSASGGASDNTPGSGGAAGGGSDGATGGAAGGG